MRYLPLYAEEPRTPIETCARLDNIDPGCKRCALHDGVRNVCIPDEMVGDGDETLLIVGESPGREEDKAGRPFVGGSGAILRDLVKRTWQGAFVLSNAIRCTPIRREMGSKKFAKKEIDACRGYLANTIAEVRPTRIICLGQWAATSVVGRNVAPLSSRKGYSYLYGFDTEEPIPVFFVMHPSMALRNKFLNAWFEEDLKWAMTCPLPEEPPTGARIGVIETKEDAEDALRVIEDQDWTTEDIEAFGVPHESNYRLLSVAVGLAVPTDGIAAFAWIGDGLDRGGDALARYHADADLIKYLQNGKYDEVGVELTTGVRVRGIRGDVRIDRKLLEPHASGSLEDMAELVGMGGYKDPVEVDVIARTKPLRTALSAEKTARKKKAQGKVYKPQPTTVKALRLLDDLQESNPGLVDLARRFPGEKRESRVWGYGLVARDNPDALVQANAGDVVTTARVKRLMARRLSGDHDLLRLKAAFADRLGTALARVERWGMPTSRANIRVFDAYLEPQLAPLQAWVDEQGFDPQSYPQTKAYLKRIGLVSSKKTKNGNASTDKEALELLEAESPEVRKIIEYRHIEHMRATYGAGMLAHIADDNRIHPTLLPDGAVTGRMSCKDPNCFDAETELLTPDGWVRIADLKRGTLVAQWTDGTVTFVPPTRYYRRKFTGTMVGVRNQHINLRVTSDHRCLVRNRKTDALRVFAAAEYPSDWQQLHGGVWNGGTLSIDENLLIVICATQADGWWHDGGVDFRFSKARKITRLCSALTALGAPYSRHRRRTRDQVAIRILKSPLVTILREYLGLEKTLKSWVLELDRRTMNHFIEEVFKWDGCITRMNHYSSSIQTNVDWVQAALTLSGKRAKVRIYMPPSGRPNYQVDVSHRDYSLTTNVTRTDEQVTDETVYCVSVPSTYVLVRRGGAVCVTGQCQNIPRAADSIEGKLARDCFVAEPGFVFLSLDFSQLELRVAAMLSHDEKMLEIYSEGADVDFHRRTAELIARTAWNIAPEDIGSFHRTAAKTVVFSTLYGAGPAKIAAQIRKALSAKGIMSDITTRDVMEIVPVIFGNYKKLDKFMKWTVREAHRSGLMRTWWDGHWARRRAVWQVADHDDGRRGHAERSIANGYIQGSAGDYCNASLVSMVEWIESEEIERDCQLVITVHDQLMFHVREELVQRVAAKATAVMTGWPTMDGMKLVVDQEVGKSWGSMEKVKKT